jgi:MFS family permease
VNTFAQLPAPTRRNLILMMLGGLCFWACMASFLPVLPLYLTDTIGVNSQELGIVMGAFAVGLLLFRPQMGPLVDRQGLKRVLLLGIFVAAIAPLFYTVAPNAGLMIAVRIFHGLSIAAFTTSYSTITADLAPPENRGELIGYMSLVNPIGMALGPALGGYLQPLIGGRQVFLIGSGIAALSLLFSSLVQVCPREPNANGPQVAQSSWKLLRSDRLKVPTISMTAVGLAFGVIIVYLPLFVKEQGLTMNVGLFYTMTAIASFVIRLMSSKASDRLGRGLFITIGLLFYVVSMIMLWQADSVATVLAAGLVEGCGGGLVLPMMIVLLTDRCDPQERPRAFSLCIGGFDLGMFLAGPCVGVLAPWIGYRGLFAMAAIVATVATLIFATQSNSSLPYSLRFALGRGRDRYALPKG